MEEGETNATRSRAEMSKLPELNLHGLAVGVAALIFFILGGLRASEVRNDFVPIYAGASCMLHGENPYATGPLIYPPSTLLVLSPLALFPYRDAWVIWFLLNGGLVVTAVVLVLSLCPKGQRWPTTAMGAVLLAGSSQLLILAQPSAFSIGLAAIGVYCFLRSRALLAGALFLMLSLAVKPQIGGLIILSLFFNGVHRRYAAMAMAGAVTLLLCGGLVLKMHPQSAGWIVDFRENLARSAAPGGIADPRPANELNSGDLNLQTVTSIFFETDKAFNAAAYAAFGILFIAWAVPVRRMKPTLENHLLSIGALSVLTLLPIYHRAYDSRLLILSIPAALIVYKRRRTLGALVCVLVALSAVSIQHWVKILLEKDGLLQIVQQNKLLFILVLRENNIRLLALSSLLAIALFNIRDREQFPPMIGNNNRSPSRA
jgi:hypothetical protein